MRGFVFFILLCSTISNDAFSQKKLYNSKFIEGEYLILEKNYTTALKNFLEAYQIDSTNANINYKVGFCYLMTLKKEKAMPFFSKAVLDVTKRYGEYKPEETQAPIISYYYLAESYHLNYQFNEAIANFQKYLALISPIRGDLIKDTKRKIEMCYNAIEFVKSPEKITITNLGDSVNSPYADYSAVISADESTLIFTSRKPGSTGGEQSSDDQYYEDIYVCSKKKDHTWSKPVSIGTTINTGDNEATIALSVDGQELFIYQGGNGGDIYTSHLEGDVWSVPAPLSSDINTKYWETHACLSSDGNTLYFVSDRPGGYGGRDIYRSLKLPNGNWGLAVNLGPTINTEYDEDATFIHSDGVTLFFSSKGHKTMGGFDIFYSIRNEDGTWTEPVNQGYPINTTEDDVFYIASADGKRAYYSSIKKEGLGDKDIYRISLSDRKIVDAVTLLKGYLTFNGGSKSPSDVRITATDLESNRIVQEIRPNSKTWKYVIILSPGANGKSYSISFEANGYKSLVETIKVDRGTEYQEIEKAIELETVKFEIAPEGYKNEQLQENNTKELVENSYSKEFEDIRLNDNSTKDLIEKTIDKKGTNTNNTSTPTSIQGIVFENILFDFNKSILNARAKEECEKIIEVLNKNPQIKVEISGHTDSKGSNKFNMRLSKKRDMSVINYLIKSGLDKSRFVSKAYGETKPLETNTLKDGMQSNRRVELKIIQKNK